ncbi:MAG TPA: hypothetical protein VEO54_13855 [Thermoanaerobaculia bacterium]|nr:hypothetical protein [Thermoanaerobaculia bacterium]
MRKAVLLLLLAALPALAEVIVPQTGAPRIWIPVAGHAQGANGTFFRSEISVTNLRSVTQRVRVYWLPQGASGATTPLQTYDVPAGRGFSSDDFVDRLLQQTGLGGIEIVGVTNTGAVDPQAVLHVTSRIWTPQPNVGDTPSEGTMSQTFPAVVVGASQAADVKEIYGMRRGTQYRLNVGVLNPAATAQRFRIVVTIEGPGGVNTETVELDVPSRAIQQILIPGVSTGVAFVRVEDLGGGAGDWQTWASSVDNLSGDAWSQMGFARP